MAKTSGLKKYQQLKKRAAAKGIAVPRGTNMAELEALIDGRVARSTTKRAPAPKKRAPRKRRATNTRSGGSLFGFD